MAVDREVSRAWTVKPLTPDLWPAFEDLVGTHGACNGCWCMYWRIGSAYHQRPRDRNRADFRRIVDDGPPPGLLAFDDERAVGWCQLTPREALPWLERAPRLARVDDTPVWSLSCFYVRKGYRRRGVSAALIAASLEMARRAGAAVVEAYPYDASRANGGAYTGVVSTFERAGFAIVAAPAGPRRIVRRTLP
jgi:GNAT superfamily N-acetyltransferase